MAVLENKTKSNVISTELEIAEGYFNIQRGIGLMGRKNLKSEQGLWIHHCKSIHTCFMNFPIDCVFVDKVLKVKSVKENVKPWRLVFSQLDADSVIELPAGTVTRKNITTGDQLYVGR